MENKVWVNGTFDVLHNGHFQLLNLAATHGRLIVGIDSDRRVRELKGDSRPYHNQFERAYNLMSIRGVYNVIVFDSDDELKELLKKNKPDYLVIGSDYRGKKIIGGEYANEIIYFDRIDHSTTKIMETWDTNNNQK
jgi:cytidyltransferase-like protein